MPDEVNSAESQRASLERGTVHAGTGVAGAHGTSNWYVLLWGVDLDVDEVSAGSSLTFRKITEPLSVFDLAALGAQGFREWAMLEPLTGGCRVEVESPADAIVGSGYDALNRVWLLSALLVFRDFGRHLPVAANQYSWSVVAGCVPRDGRPARNLPPFRGTLLDYHPKLLTLPRFENRRITPGDGAWLAAWFPVFDGLAFRSPQFRFALEAGIDWRYQSDMRSAIARIWSGIESLFALGAELTYRLSASAASLLEPRGPARLARFKAIQDLYARRSRVVHGNPVSDRDLENTCSGSFELLRDLILLAVMKGHVPSKDDIETALFE